MSLEIDNRLRLLRDIVQVDVGNRGLARDPVDNLLTACPDDFAAACRSIAEQPSPHVGIVTGFMIPSVNPPTGETDGPPGSLFLALVLRRLGMRCTLFSDAAGWNALKVGCGFWWLDEPPAISRAILPTEVESSILPKDITHLIAIERSGPSRLDGRNRTMRGTDIAHLTAPAHRLFEGRRSYVTIGVGDGGNEIGMGKIPFETICKNIPNGEQTACRTATDHLIVAGVSNWGANALAAGIMLLRGDRNASLFDPEKHQWLLQELVDRAPLVDGVTGQRTATVDGLTFDAYSKPLVAIQNILK